MIRIKFHTLLTSSLMRDVSHAKPIKDLCLFIVFSMRTDSILNALLLYP